MKKTIIRAIITLLVLLIFILLYRLYINSNGREENVTEDIQINPDIEENKPSMGKNDRNLTVWTVYWDSYIMDEIKEIGSSIEEICYFAAYFDSNKSLFIPTRIMDIKNKLKNEMERKSYLTFVNDLILENGSSSLKDTDLLYTLLSTEENRANHIKDIVNLTQSHGYDGIEIDYEGIKKDMKLWDYFLLFLRELFEVTEVEDIPLRILLEPGVDTKALDFPKGPTYIMMCYNLYGYGTEPGPKANREFLLEMIDKMRHVPGKTGFAIATGGFDFHEDGKVEQVSENRAIEIKNHYDVKEYRDEDSKAIYYNYMDANEVHHEVWYADEITLDYWFSIFEDKGDYNLSLWRIES